MISALIAGVGLGGHLADAELINCPSDMVAVENFCVDRFEAPNIEGAHPMTAVTAPEGEKWCNERGKELCTEEQWVAACQGVEKNKFPYGTQYKKGICNDDKEWINPSWKKIAKYPKPEGKAEVARLYQADPSGSRKGCVTRTGVHDLTGNVAEWVVSTKSRYGHVLKGCYWSGCYGGSPPSCTFANRAHAGTFRTYEAGFRCCSKEKKE